MSSRKNRSPEEKARREKIRELLQLGNIGSMEDIQDLFKETIGFYFRSVDVDMIQLHILLTKNVAVDMLIAYSLKLY